MELLITGAGGGMGSAACALFAREGHTVWGMDIKPPTEPVPWRFLQVDVTDEGSVAAAAENLKGEGVTFDAVIHHAGVYDLNSLVETDEAAVQRLFAVNLFGAMRVNRLFLPLFKEHARVILTSSELAPLDPLPFTGLYAVTKTAVERYAFALRMELQLLGYSVAVVRPGAVRTKLLDVSTRRLDDFCEKTALYACNAARFRAIVNAVEARSVPPERVALLDRRILKAKRPRYVYSLNRNPGLLLLHCLPQRTQTWLIGKILK